MVNLLKPYRIHTDKQKILLMISLLVSFKIPCYYAYTHCLLSNNIECFCNNSSAICNGSQEYIEDISELFFNLSNIFSNNLLQLDLDIKNLHFQPNFTISNFNLESLTVGKGLRDINKNLFLDLELTLVNLNLHDNEVELIDQPFSSLHNLKELRLAKNGLKSIETNIFVNLSKLEYLSLAENQLTSLENKFLIDLPEIQTLDLSNNDFYFLQNINLTSPTLLTLVASNCSINGSVNKEVLSGVPRLKYLDLSFNNLLGLESYAMSSLTSLETLNLSTNELDYLNENAFTSLYNLITLDLSNNKLSLIKETAFQNLTKLKHLDLSGNMLEAILSVYTADLYALEKLNLQNNNIKLVTDGSFSTSVHLQELFFAGNALDCSCESSYFASYLMNNSYVTVDQDILCYLPYEVRGSQLTSINFAAMNCEVDDLVPPTDDDYDDYGSTDVPASSTLLNLTDDAVVTNSSNVTDDVTPIADTITVISTVEFLNLSTQSTTVTTTVDIGNETTLGETTTVSVSSETVPISKSEALNVTTPTLPKTSELSINIIDSFTKDADFCLRWHLGGSIFDVPTCSIQINSKTGKKFKNLKCPTSNNEVQQCVFNDSEIYEFCINVYVSGMRKGKSCSKFESQSSTSVTTPKKSTISTTVSFTSTTSISTITTTKKLPTPTTDITTEKLSTPMTKSTSNRVGKMPTSQATPRKTFNYFNIVHFDVLFNYMNSTATVTWQVNMDEEDSMCHLKLIMYAQRYNVTKGPYTCKNSSYIVEEINDKEMLKICLLSFHYVSGNRMFCESSGTLPYELLTGGTKDYGYRNHSLIALLCLLVVVVIIIGVIILKNVLKKKSEADMYNVQAEEKNVLKRMPSKAFDPSVRYSYTVKEA